MRDRPGWMTVGDHVILELLDESEKLSALSPDVIAFNLEMDRDHVNRRLSEFTERGYVDRVARGKYELTEKGREYLND